MANIHFMMQGKGGVGKSYIAFYIIQYMMQMGRKLKAFDTDFLNPTLGRKKSLNVTTLPLLPEGETRIDSAPLDRIVEAMDDPEVTDVFVDVGANTFIPLLEYADDMQLGPQWEAEGHRIVIHSVIIGTAFLDCIQKFDMLMETLGASPSSRAIVWLNPFFGAVESGRKEEGGKTFLETKTFEAHKNRISGIGEVPFIPSDVFTKSIQNLIKSDMTIDEMINSPGLLKADKMRFGSLKSKMYKIIGETMQNILSDNIAQNDGASEVKSGRRSNKDNAKESA